MSEEKLSFVKDMEELVSKSMEANKIFLNEGIRMAKQFTNSPGDKKNVNLFQPELISNAVNAFTKLNIQYLKNLIGLGLSLTKEAGKSTDGASLATVPEERPGPAFVLNATVVPGSRADLQFLLDNVKKEPVLCTFLNTVYQNQSDQGVKPAFKTNFSPQTFTIQPGASQTIHISVTVPDGTVPGDYFSNVQVKGFEPVYFSIQLTVDKKQNKTPGHGSRRKGK